MKKLYFLFTILICTASFGQVINEVDADTPGTDMAEFVEILWTPNTALDNLSVVFFNGNDDASYQVYDLDGFVTDADGFFILANDGIATASDISIGASNVIQNGADAVALYSGDFVSGDPVTATNLLSGVVYDTGDADDADLLAAIGGVQYDERENNNSDGQSIQRNNDGTYTVKSITFRADNNAAVCDLSLGSISAICDASTTGTDTYTVTLDFTGGGTSNYTVTADSGVVVLSAGDPSTDATGTITVTGVNEGTDLIITVQDGVLCNLSSMATSPVCEPSNSLPLYEGFDYTVADELGNQTLWEDFSGGTTNPIDVVAGSLSYTDFSASTGNSINMIGGSVDSRLLFDEVTTGEVYASFLVNVTDISSITDLNDGGYFAVFGSTTNSFRSRLWVKPTVDATSGTVDFAYNAEGTGSGFGQTQNLNDTVLIVISYNVVSGVSNLWVNPSSSDFGAGSPPTADATNTDASPTSVDRFILRQDSTGETPNIIFDELRLGTNWADVTPSALSTQDITSQATFNMFPNPTNTGIVTITSVSNEAINVQVFDVLGKGVKNQIVTNNTLNVSDLKSGIYFVRISQNTSTVTKKLVIK